MIEKLCEKYTPLNHEEINKIKEVSKSLQIMANFYENDVFIDVLSEDKEYAIVIDHAIPIESTSIYKETIIGKKALEENEPAVLESLKNGKIKKDIKAVTQENKFVTQRIQPIIYEKKIIAVIIVETDISDSLEKNFKIKVDFEEQDDSSKNFFELVRESSVVTDNLHDAIIVYDEVGKLLLKNSNADSIYRKIGNVDLDKEKRFDKLSLDDEKFENIIRNYKSGITEKHVIEIQKGSFYFEINRTIIVNTKLRVIESIKDITDIKNKEAELILKSVAIREAHHRVKNSLQTVASLLRSQSRNCNNIEVKEYLQESINRIFAIATTHDILSKAKNSEISVREAIGTLTQSIMKSGIEENVDIYINGDNFYIDGEKLTSLLLVINELIQNCFDHAFKEKDNGTIQILIQSHEENKIIAVIDDGIGYDINNDQNSKSLGQKIIKSYVKDKLKGELDVKSSESGTQVVIKFKN